MEECKICNYKFKNKRSLASHLQNSHSITAKEYTIKYLSMHPPKCLECDNEPRYHSFSFKRYCKQHALKSMSEAGKHKGPAPWNKGKTKETDDRIKRMAENASGEGNHFYGKTHSKETKAKLKKSFLLSRAEFRKRANKSRKYFSLISTYDDYFSKDKTYLQVKCVKCGYEGERTLKSLGAVTKCRKCFPLSTNSTEEKTLLKFVSSISRVEENVRGIIGNKEFDIYSSDKKIAIEYNGLYWHTEQYRKRADHHNKSILSIEEGVDLIHVFSDEWDGKREIVESLIRRRFGASKTTISRKDCSFREIPVKDSRAFLEMVNLDGPAPAKMAFGVFSGDKLIACVSVKDSRRKECSNFLEIVKIGLCLDCYIDDGFNFIVDSLENYAKLNNFNGLVSLSDLRLGKEFDYESCGFIKTGKTNIPYWYTDGSSRFTTSNGSRKKIFGCRSIIYLKDFNEAQ